MNWEDTVLSDERIEEIARSRERIKWQEYGKDIAEAQAEASFKAGVRVVVDWVEKHKKQRIPNYQKEEWGIKEVT